MRSEAVAYLDLLQESVVCVQKSSIIILTNQHTKVVSVALDQPVEDWLI